MNIHSLIAGMRLMFALVFSAAACAGMAQDAPATPSTVMFTGKEAASVVADAIARQNAAGDIKVSINEAREQDVLVQSAGPVTADTDALSIDKDRNRWQATLLLKADGRNLAPIRLSGRYDEMTAVPVLKRRILPGEVIAEEDIDWSHEPTQRLRKNTVTDQHDIIGKSPKHMLSQGRSIRLDEIASPAILNKGARVTLMYKSHNIEIETYGEAMDAGAKGDVIRVRNITSKIVVQGTIESSDRVRVTAPQVDSAEAM